ncbi:MAG: hypothetical protein RSA67_05860 [Alistipes sp.]
MMTAQEILKQAKPLGVCHRLTGRESTRELMRLVFTPQGIEFCTKHHFPTMEIFREFKGKEAEGNGIFIDTRTEQHNIERVMLVGDTNATLIYDGAAKRYQVVLMHGARAMIKASGYAVVFVTNAGGEVVTDIRDFAMVL